MNIRLINLLIAVVFFLLITFATDAAQFYRYKDKKGKVVVSSTLPPEVSQKGYDIVNEMGVVLKEIAPRKTKKQLQEELAEKARQKEETRKKKEQEQLDTILINSYTDISDIERARDNELISKDRDIMLLKQNIRRLTRLLEDTQTRAARDERLGREIHKSLLNEVKTFKRRITAETKEVDMVLEHKARISERYASSIIRFSELKAAEQLRRHRPGDLESEDVKAVIYKCPSEAQCDRAWQGALHYASEYSTTELAWANDRTIMMRKPRNDDDVSVMVSRVVSFNSKEASLVMEVRCNKTQAGENFCKSEKVQAIEKGFIAFINKG